MKTLGLIGGTAPESTIEYYRLIIETYRDRVRDGSYPSFLIDSINLRTVVDLVTGDRLAELTDFLLAEVGKLARAGADFGLIAANTPHVVFGDLAPRSPIPLLSIVDATCDAAESLGLRKVGLLGTRFTMQGRFYRAPFEARGIALSVPGGADQAYLHEKYMGEFVDGVFRAEVRDELLAIVDRLVREHGVEGVILGGTELPLALGDQRGGTVPFLDTTRIHVQAAVARMLS